MEKPGRLEDLTFILNTQEIPNGICTKHSLRATAQVVAYCNKMPTNATALVCCAEGCTGDAFSSAQKQAAILLAKGQLEIYSEKKWD